MWNEFRGRRLQAFQSALAAGKVDDGILRLLKKINKNPALVTTSSCFGRIVLLAFDLDSGKKTAEFHRKWHNPVSAEEIETAVSQYSGRLPLWFKVEPFILHVSAKDYAAAEEFMEKIRVAGVKRGGIQGTVGGRMAIEVQGTAWMSFPISLARPRWKEIAALANKMMKINSAQIKKLERMF